MAERGEGGGSRGDGGGAKDGGGQMQGRRQLTASKGESTSATNEGGVAEGELRAVANGGRGWRQLVLGLRCETHAAAGAPPPWHFDERERETEERSDKSAHRFFNKIIVD